jgi:ketosteroid isomerase-like protein
MTTVGKWAVLMGVAFAALGLAGFAQRPARVDLEAAKAAMMAADAEFSRVTGERGLEGFSSFLADDVTNIRPNAPLVQGRQKLAEGWARLLNDPAAKIEWQPIYARAASSGEFGYTIGVSKITRTDAEGKRTVSTGKYVTIWQKQANGSWKVVHDSGVQDTQP